MSVQKLDDYDLAILRLLQEDASRPQRQIAEMVSLSAAAVQRRIARLEMDGVIRRTVAVIDPAAVGFALTVLVEVTLRDDRTPTVAAAKDLFRKAADVQQCYWIAGTAGLMVVIISPTTDAYERRAAQLFGDNDLVRSYRSIVVLDRVKVGLAVPL